jgi:hypothetical protein
MAAGSEDRGEIDWCERLYTQRMRKHILVLAKEKMESLAGEVERKVAGANGHTYRLQITLPSNEKDGEN